MGLDISFLEIDACMALMYTGEHAESISKGALYYKYGYHAAFLSEELDLWYAGGLDDMAANIIWKWNTLI